MPADRRPQFLLGALAVTMAVAGYLQWPRAASHMAARGGNAAPVHGAMGPGGITAPDVHLEILSVPRPGPGDHARNLFKFSPKVHVAPPAPARAQEHVAPSVPQHVGPPPPPPPPPIALKFIGLLETAGTSKVAILSDGRGSPVHGKEGDAVLGQYRILRINADSIEMSYLDGRGRQTIRLSGS